MPCKPGVRMLDALLNAGVDYMHACGGKGRCTTCKAVVIAGMEGLGVLTDAEIKYKQANRLKDNERLACQVCPNSAVVIRVAPENYMPHMQYVE